MDSRSDAEDSPGRARVKCHYLRRWSWWHRCWSSLCRRCPRRGGCR